MYKIKLTERPVGFALGPAKQGEMGGVEFRGIAVQSEGREFLRKIKALNSILSKLPEQYDPFMIKTVVVIINEDLEATVYVNEIEILARIAVNKHEGFTKGEAVRINDILHVQELSVEGVSFPKDSAYLVLLSQDWDRIFYYDYGPLLSDKDVKRDIDYSVNHFLSYGYSRALFYEVYDITEEQWNLVISSGWFPFAYTNYQNQQLLIQHILLSWDYSKLLTEINTDFCADSTRWLTSLFSKSAHSLNKHQGRVERALDFHLSGDYDSAVHLMYPRLESVLRDDFLMHNTDKGGRRQTAISEHIATHITEKSYSVSLYFPEQFCSFLKSIFFQDFDPHSDLNPVSRNSISHGAIAEDLIGMKESLMGFLIFDQICRYIKFSTSVEGNL
ncbi:hypothetical protein BB427_00700 [Pseudoalteromonas sp. BMB]|uniref:hypothetical protein n=1 Tax=Pseudoalteromonas sp. BMB TaxID=1874619 RepID=UPI00083E058E|nr:hypothetical protein [Pseudoalteromonas sp. BMB]ODB44942.1 hypothetical protein BB427_00700 [Pseudoalteromonas sp. BMB]